MVTKFTFKHLINLYMYLYLLYETMLRVMLIHDTLAVPET